MPGVPVILNRMPLETLPDGHCVVGPVDAEAVLAINGELARRARPILDPHQRFARDGPRPFPSSNLVARKPMSREKILPHRLGFVVAVKRHEHDITSNFSELEVQSALIQPDDAGLVLKVDYPGTVPIRPSLRAREPD